MEAARLQQITEPVRDAPDSPAPRPRCPKDSFMAAMAAMECRTGEALDPARQKRRLLKEQLAAYGHALNIDVSADPLKYWQDHRENFSYLLPLARRYGAIPSSTADAERLFSMAKHFLADNRHSSESIDKQMRLSLNLPDVGLWHVPDCPESV